MSNDGLDRAPTGTHVANSENPLWHDPKHLHEAHREQAAAAKSKDGNLAQGSAEEWSDWQKSNQATIKKLQYLSTHTPDFISEAANNGGKPDFLDGIWEHTVCGQTRGVIESAKNTVLNTKDGAVVLTAKYFGTYPAIAVSTLRSINSCNVESLAKNLCDQSVKNVMGYITESGFGKMNPVQVIKEVSQHQLPAVANKVASKPDYYAGSVAGEVLMMLPLGELNAAKGVMKMTEGGNLVLQVPELKGIAENTTKIGKTFEESAKINPIKTAAGNEEVKAEQIVGKDGQKLESANTYPHLPPVAEGSVRLYRVEPIPRGKIYAPLRENILEDGWYDRCGRWWAEDPEIALLYRECNNEDVATRLLYQDVPQNVYESSRVDRIPEAAVRSKMREEEWFLPKDYVGKGKVVEEFPPIDPDPPKPHAPISITIRKI